MSGRSYSNENQYRYGFNGKENDNEIKGIGNQQDYGLRIYNPRLGRFFSEDPLTPLYPWYTLYQFAGNMPIRFVDLDGSEPAEPGKNGEKRTGTNGNSDIAVTWKSNGSSWEEDLMDNVIITTKTNYYPEKNFLNNDLTSYNSKTEWGFQVSFDATAKSLLLEFAYNYKSNLNGAQGSRNKLILSGPLFKEVKNLESVQNLFRRGVASMYKDKKLNPGETFVEYFTFIEKLRIGKRQFIKHTIKYN